MRPLTALLRHVMVSMFLCNSCAPSVRGSENQPEPRSVIEGEPGRPPCDAMPRQGEKVEHREEVDQRGDRQHSVAPLQQTLRPDLGLDAGVQVIRSWS